MGPVGRGVTVHFSLCVWEVCGVWLGREGDYSALGFEKGIGI